jgi:hypothetical protein
MHSDCQEKGNASSTPVCCNCQLAEGETAHPANYRGCRHAKETMRKKKPQETFKGTTGRVFSSTFTKPHQCFAAELRGQVDKLHQVVAVSTTEPKPPKPKSKQQETGQSVLAPIVSSDTLDKLRALTVVQQYARAVSEDVKIFAITKIVINLMKENGK